MQITFNPNWPNPPELVGTSMSDWAFAHAIAHPETQLEIVEADEVVNPWQLLNLIEAGCDSITVYKLDPH